jgi:2-polyprenyl-3-methyl-5-hydroxy-6-metoxy-1,4-benzoquinol methylase
MFPLANSQKSVSVAKNMSLRDDPYVKEHQKMFIPYFREKKLVVDLGCGRGRFLRSLMENNIPGLGVEMSKQLVLDCKKQGFNVQQSDVLTFLKGRPPKSVDGFFISHLIEHFSPKDAIKIFQGMSKALKPNGVIVMVTPNCRCLGVISQSFWEDPTHLRLYPYSLLALLAKEAGLQVIDKGETDMNNSNSRLKNMLRAFLRSAYRAFRTALIGNFFRPYDLYVVFKK